MRANPSYYRLSEREQLRYRFNMPEGERFVLERSIFKDLYNVNCKTEEALRNAWRDLPISELNSINEVMLPWQGIGEDCFYLNEYFPDDKWLAFETVDDYARDDYAFQQSIRREENRAYRLRPYQGNLHSRWIRLFVDGVFHNGTLNSLAGHLCDYIDDRGHELINELIPHRYVRGPDDGKRRGNSYIWDMRRDANGLEPHLEELTVRFYRYQNRRWREMLEEFDGEAVKATYIREPEENGDPQIHFVFSDQWAMRAVRFRRFVRDCRRLAQDPARLKEMERRELETLRTFMREQHRDILDNFNPKIARLDKKRRMFMYRDAF